MTAARWVSRRCARASLGVGAGGREERGELHPWGCFAGQNGSKLRTWNWVCRAEGEAACLWCVLEVGLRDAMGCCVVCVEVGSGGRRGGPAVL